MTAYHPVNHQPLRTINDQLSGSKRSLYYCEELVDHQLKCSIPNPQSYEVLTSTLADLLSCEDCRSLCYGYAVASIIFRAKLADIKDRKLHC